MTERDDRQPSDDAFAKAVRRVLDGVPLDAETATRLAAIRRRAVEQTQTDVTYVPPRWVPVSAMAFTLLVVGTALRLGDDHTLPVLEDDALFAAAQERELLEELELLAYFDELDHAG